ncbi:protein of unknown function [Xenorhabdus poinarii G6]|uniref:Uncharacterized protein n=1 Tax=Xenorhabdus poinarii G6 TaxID=1354304 RepID=A0A068R4I0_9GAMM|nr:hypothetical protein [Xenorhabdus poinarii]CDG21944.1 protein of unknown function [Xenorhabdus poinarii G6]
MQSQPFLVDWVGMRTALYMGNSKNVVLVVCMCNLLTISNVMVRKRVMG